MNKTLLAVLGLVGMISAPPLLAQSDSAADLVQRFEESLVKLQEQGIDPRAPTYQDLQGEVSSMKRLAGQIAEKEAKNDRLQKRIDSLNDDLERYRREMARLAKLLEQEKLKLMEEMKRYIAQAAHHNANPPDSENEAAVEAYMAEKERGDRWQADLMSRKRALDEGSDALRLRDLSAKCDAINREIKDTANQADDTIKEDVRAFNAAKARALKLIADLAKPLTGKRAAKVLPAQNAFDQLIEVYGRGEKGGTRFDSPEHGERVRNLPNYSPPPVVSEKPKFQKAADDLRLIESQREEWKAKLRDPRATPAERQGAFKQIQGLDSAELWRRYQQSLMSSPNSVPARKPATSKVPPLPLLPVPDIN